MPTIYLKDRIFSKIVNAGHYNDYEKLLDRGVDLALAEELEARQVPKSEPGPLPGQPEDQRESPPFTFTEKIAATVTEASRKDLCMDCCAKRDRAKWEAGNAVKYPFTCADCKQRVDMGFEVQRIV